MPKSAIPQTRQIPNPEYGSIQKVARNSGSPLREIGKLFPGIQKRGFFVAMAEIRKPIVRPALPDAVSLAGGGKVPSLIPARVSERIWLLQTLNYSPQGLICEIRRHTARKLPPGQLARLSPQMPTQGHQCHNTPCQSSSGASWICCAGISISASSIWGSFGFARLVLDGGGAGSSPLDMLM